jgi:hypothetical protein
MDDDRKEHVASQDPAKEVYWTPLMAVVWIVYRDINEVRKVWPAFVNDHCDFHFEGNVKYVVSPIEAVKELWRRHELGELVATGISQGLRRVIKSWEWCDLQPIDCKQPARFLYGRQFPRKLYIGRPPMLFDDVLLPVGDLLGLFPAKDPTSNESLGKAKGFDRKLRSSRKPSKVEAIAGALSQLFPDGRPPITNDEIGRRLKDPELGLGGFSPRTLSRAIAKAWPATDGTR